MKLPALGGEVLGMIGMVNLCESLINAVNPKEPKVLLGSTQQGKQLGCSRPVSCIACDNVVGKIEEPNPICS